VKKRIVICADGTWNKPEKNLKKDFPTNILKLSRAIKPVDKNNIPQQVFYDWGIGSYHNSFAGGVTGKGLHKNVKDCYRYLVQNYSLGDELFFFGFSRGAYTIRSLCGLINNCGILKRPDAKLIEKAFKHYKNPKKDYQPNGKKSIQFREDYSFDEQIITFVGIWDTVGALGIPFSFMGLLDKEDEFYDNKMGPNIQTARHALAIDELRSDFEPTIWEPRKNLNLKQVWFAGVHTDIGGSYPPDKNTGYMSSDISLKWMLEEAMTFNLCIESHLIESLNPRFDSKIHKSRKNIYRSKKAYYRPIDHGKGEILIHQSVKDRWDNSKYRPKNLKKYIDKHGWTKLVK